VISLRAIFFAIQLFIAKIIEVIYQLVQLN